MASSDAPLSASSSSHRNGNVVRAHQARPCHRRRRARIRRRNRAPGPSRKDTRSANSCGVPVRPTGIGKASMNLPIVGSSLVACEHGGLDCTWHDHIEGDACARPALARGVAPYPSRNRELRSGIGGQALRIVGGGPGGGLRHLQGTGRRQTWECPADRSWSSSSRRLRRVHLPRPTSGRRPSSSSTVPK